jgi:integrase/recombinase XerD
MKQLPIHNKSYVALHKEFVQAMAIQGYSTADWCTAPTREFLFFAETKGIKNLGKMKAQDIIAYYEYLCERPNQKRDGPLSEKSIRHYIYSIRLFFDYLLAAGHIEKSPARLPKFLMGGSAEKEVLTVAEIKLLYKHAGSLYVKALLALAYGCGLRYMEIRKLNISDVLFHKGVLNVRGGKNNKSRTVPMSEGVMKDLKEYLVYDRVKRINLAKPCNGFLITKNGCRVKNGTINHHHLKWLAKRTGSKSIMAKGLHLHALRHAITTHLIEAGAPIEFVRRFLGHAMLDTTMLYAKRRKQKMLKQMQGESL